MTTEHKHTHCAMCTSRCGVIATVVDGRFNRVVADPDHPNGCICVKGTAAPEMVYSPDRIQFPLMRTTPKTSSDPGWQRMSWEQALDHITARLASIRNEVGAESVVFGSATTAGSSAVDFFPYVQRLANVFGSPNILFSNHLCGWHRMASALQTFGIGVGQPDFDNTECILLWGYNPQASKPTDAMKIRRAQTRGARLIVIDPRKSGSAENADLWLRVRPGTDGVLALAMIHVLMEESLYDQDFVRTWTNGAFLVRDDTGRLLTERDVTAAGDPLTPMVWDSQQRIPVAYRRESGFEDLSFEPTLRGEHICPLADGSPVTCRPALAELRSLAEKYAPEQSERITGVPADQVRQAARLFATRKPSSYLTWVGLEEHAAASQIGRAVSIFYALTGQIDQRGSNVRFAGTPTKSIVGRELLPEEEAARTLGASERPIGPPGASGLITAYDLYRAILQGQPYPVNGLVTFGTDLLMGNGDPQQGRRALESLDFYVHVDLFINPSARFADILLPAASCWEREALNASVGSGEAAATWAQLRSPVIPPLYESRSDLAIIFDLATRLGHGAQFWDGDIHAAFAEELEPSGVALELLRQEPIGVRTPGETRYRKYAEVDRETGRARGFATPSGKVELYSTQLAKAGYSPLPDFGELAECGAGDINRVDEFPLLLTFFRLVQYRDVQDRGVPRLRRLVPEPFLEIHPRTAEVQRIGDGEWVRVETHHGRIRLKAKFVDTLDPGVVSTAHGWWQACRELGLPGYDPFGDAGSNANALVSNAVIDPISGSVPHRSQPCRVLKIQQSIRP